MKKKILCMIMLLILGLSIFSCNKKQVLYDTELPHDEDKETDIIGFKNETNISIIDDNHTSDVSSSTDEKSNSGNLNEVWVDLSAIGGSENPYRELYGTAVSGFLIVKGTFTDTNSYYDEAEGQRFGELACNYKEEVAGVPLLTYLFREMGITKQEYIDYLNALDPNRNQDDYQENIDILFSDDDDLINETFHTPLTLYHEGKIYTIYELNEISRAETLNKFPAKKVAELYKNIQEFNEKEHILMPDDMNGMLKEMANIASHLCDD